MLSARWVALAGVLVLVGPAAAATGPLQLGQVRFEPCEIQTPRAGVYEALCARHAVPENPAAPEGRRLELRLVLLKAAARKPLPDPVLFLAGGPGQSAVEAWPLVRPALARLAQRRHVLLVDQRGTGQSNPLPCPLADWKEPADMTPEAARRQAADCHAGVRDRADTRFYATADYVRDLESVRAALGVAQFNVAGGSYGTRVGLEYLRRHPGAVRSLFIDSVVPPELALLQDHAGNLERALAATAARCTADVQCRERFGDMHATLHALRQQLRDRPRLETIADPVTFRPLQVPFNELALLWVARFFSYAPESVALLPLLLHEAAQGRPQPLLAQVERLARALPGELMHGMELSVVCAEDADLLEVQDADGDSLMGNGMLALLRAQCEAWPHGTRAADFKDPVVSDVPVLLLSGEYDPVTPPRYAAQVAKTLSRSRHLVAKGQGHTPMAQGCMPRLLQQFVETLDPAGLEAGCLDVLGDTPFFLDYAGPAP